MNTNKTYIAATSMVSDVTGAAIDMRGLERLGVEAVWGATASPSGTLALEGSYDYDEGPDSGTWVAIASGTFASSPDGSGAGSTSENFRGIMAPFVRVVYTAGSGGTGASLDVAIAHL